MCQERVAGGMRIKLCKGWTKSNKNLLGHEQGGVIWADDQGQGRDGGVVLLGARVQSGVIDVVVGVHC